MTANTTQRVDVERLTELLAESGLRLPLCQFGAHVDGADGDTVADCYYNAAHEQDGRTVAELFAAAVNALPALLQQLAELEAKYQVAVGKYCAATDRLLMMFDAKNEWAERARAAESKLAEQAAEIERANGCIAAAEEVAHIYFDIASEAIGEDEVRKRRDCQIASVASFKRRAESAERAREEACGLLRACAELIDDRDADALYGGGFLSEAIAAFLAANGN